MLFPFKVKSSWYDDYWLADQPTPTLPRARLAAASIVSVFALLLAGLRGLH